MKFVHKLIELLRKHCVTKLSESKENFRAVAEGSFAKDWDNEKDAIYDCWKVAYHVS